MLPTPFRQNSSNGDKLKNLPQSDWGGHVLPSPPMAPPLYRTVQSLPKLVL